MKKILFVLAALFLMAPMMTQTAQAQLRIDGNDYYYGDKELSNSELLQFYADQNQGVPMSRAVQDIALKLIEETESGVTAK